MSIRVRTVVAGGEIAGMAPHRCWQGGASVTMIESEPAAQAVSSQAARDADLGPGPVAGPPRESDMVDPLGVVGDESASDLYQRASLLPARHIALPRDPNGHFRR